LYHPEIGESIFSSSGTSGAVSDDLLCAEASRLVYKKCENPGAARTEVEDALRATGFREMQAFCEKDSQAFAAWSSSDRLAIVAFRGTEQTIGDFVTDFKFGKEPWPAGGFVHRGFKEAFDCIWPKVDSWLQAHEGRLLLTGHSLGAALAALAASSLKDKRADPMKLVTFGSPKVGTCKFKDTLEGMPVARYMNCCDLVTRMPPAGFGYKHVGTLCYIDRFGKIHTDSKASVILDAWTARSGYVFQYWRPGNVLIRGFADHTPLNYVYALRA
jgi:predicted lipase